MRFNFFSKSKSGFTLIEIMVSVSIFAFVMIISSASVISVIEANRKSQSLRSVIDNLNLTLESFTRAIRFGTTYHCDAAVGNLSQTRDCGGVGASSLSIYDTNGVQVTYRKSNPCTATSCSIVRSIGSGVESAITSPDVTITNLTFRVYGSPPWISGSSNCSLPNDCFQPQVIIVVSGFAGTKATSQSIFALETTVSQRIFDFQ